MSITTTETSVEHAAALQNGSRTQGASKLWRRSNSVPKGHPEYDHLLWRIQARLEDAPAPAVGVCGARKGSGASTIAANLALRAAEQQTGRVLLIDATGQNAGMQQMFRVPQAQGLADILSGAIAVREFEPVSLLDNLDFIPTGQAALHGNLRIHQHLVEEALAELGHQYSMIVVDLPEPLDSMTTLAKHLAGVVLVVASETVRPAESQRMLRQLQQDGVAVWGAVLNRQRKYVPRWLQRWL